MKHNEKGVFDVEEAVRKMLVSWAREAALKEAWRVFARQNLLRDLERRVSISKAQIIDPVASRLRDRRPSDNAREAETWFLPVSLRD
mgnify:CR=1 FL=1